MDVLSEVLRVVRLEGALFFNAEFSAPWCISEPRSNVIASHLSPGAGHLILYHFLTEGRAYSAAEYRAWLSEAGLTPGAIVPTLVHCGVLPATKG